MKRHLHKIIACFCGTVLFASTVFSTTYSNKTFLAPRPVGVNAAMEYTTWHNLIGHSPESQGGFNVELTGFYQESTNKTEIGKYFGVDGKNNFVLDAAGTNVNYRYLIHKSDPINPDTSTANVKFEPKQTTYGARLDYYQDLHKLIKGLYFKLNTSFVELRNDLQMNIFDTAGELAGDDLKNYFAGTYQVFDATTDNLQAKLTSAKIDGKKSVSGFADVDLTLGYKIIDTEKYYFALNLGLTIPTGNKVKGQYIFEPIRGNGRHYAFGGGVESQIKLWEKENQSIKLIYTIDYRYLLKEQEKRTPSFNRTFTNQSNLSHYYLLGKASDEVNQSLIPAANILTTDIDVRPGGQLDSIVQFAYTNKGFTFDLGYNVFYKQEESVSLRTDPFATDVYGVADINYYTDDAFGENLFWAVDEHALSILDLDLDSVKTPAQLTHKVYGGFGYVWHKATYSGMAGIGGSYEFATDNNALEVWGAWLKIGFGF